MKRFVVTFKDWIEVDNEEDAYDKLLDYLSECVEFRDVTAFEFEEDEQSVSDKLYTSK